jgi:hypothetical protein
MTLGTRFIAALLLLGLACVVQAEPAGELTLKKKPAKLSINIVKQKDGTIIERLDLSAMPAASRDDGVPGTPNEWLARMIDPTRNGLVVKRPQLLAEWLDAVTEPRFMTALATVAMDPSTYPKTLNRMADPATARNWSEFIDPEVFMRWAAAGMDPRLYQAVFQHMFDPRKYLRWANYLGYSRNDAPGAPDRGNAMPNVSDAYAKPAISTQIDEQAWMQLSTREPKSNPWLAGSNTYRY